MRRGLANAGRQVFPAAPAYTAAARLLAAHKLHLAHQFDCLVPRCTSPGPAAYAPAPLVSPARLESLTQYSPYLQAQAKHAGMHHPILGLSAEVWQ